MAQDSKASRATAAPAAASASEDFSEAIEQSMERKPGEEVRSVRVFDNCYRCNWWVLDKRVEPMYLSNSTGRIIRSRFLRVTRTEDGLVIEDVSLAR